MPEVFEIVIIFQVDFSEYGFYSFSDIDILLLKSGKIL